MEVCGQLQASSAHCVGGWVTLRLGLDAVAKKIPSPCRESEASRPARSLVTILTELLDLD
jgi:hypothetical protein